MSAEWVSELEAELVSYAGRAWDRFRERGRDPVWTETGPAPRLDWLWELVRLCRHAKQRGLSDLTPRDRSWLRDCYDLVRSKGIETLARRYGQP